MAGRVKIFGTVVEQLQKVQQLLTQVPHEMVKLLLSPEGGQVCPVICAVFLGGLVTGLQSVEEGLSAVKNTALLTLSSLRTLR